MSLAGRTALVTGAAGFLGSHLAAALLREGTRVRALDDLSTGRRSALASLGDAVEFVEGDVREPTTVAPLAAGSDLIFHLAARGAADEDDPVADHEVNAQGTLVVLEAARAARVRRVVLASSWRVYGAGADGPLAEDAVVAPDSHHAIQKHCAEVYAGLYARLHAVDTLSLRYFPIFGPGQRADAGEADQILALARARAADEATPEKDEREAHEPGAPRARGADDAAALDLIFVDDAVGATLRAAQVSAPEPERSVVNVGSGRPAGACPALAGLARSRGARPRVASLARAAEVLGCQETIGVEEGFARTVAWIRDAASVEQDR